MTRIEVIMPRSLAFDRAGQERIINNFLQMTADAIQVDFETTTMTWKRRPEFVQRITYAGGRREVRIFTTNLIYKFVSGGTRIRYATMTPDFMPKTRPGYIGSNRGRGGRAFISRMRPRPGIKARDFPGAIVKKWQKELGRQLQRAINAEVARGR